jgi:lipopolysaccharide/colanic/teichoic acid biosynthesis glycosyltransferase
MVKRALDASIACVGLVLFSPLLVLVALAIKLQSCGGVLFRQERIGRAFKPFLIYKFRTMTKDAPSRGASITAAGDARITGVGRLLRKTKLDELPQLWNVLKGDMSLVGPRPEVKKYVDLFRDDYAELLTVRPGITDLASLVYRDESALLAGFDSPEDAYVTRILPEKIRLAKWQVQQSSLLFDLMLIVRTVLWLAPRIQSIDGFATPTPTRK